MKRLLSSGAVTGLGNSKRGKSPWAGCMKSKQTRKSLRRNNNRSQVRCAVIHSDVCGPMSVPSFSGCRYFVSFVDEHTGYIDIVPLIRKSDVLAQFKIFHAWLERKLDCILRTVQSDNGGEYIGIRDYLEEKGIEHRMSLPSSPNLNGMVERANRTIMESARSMLEHASLPRKFWAEAVVHAARIRNMFFCPRNQFITSYELMTDRKPDVSYLRVFGSLGWYHVPRERRKKLDAKSELGIMIACQENRQYKLWIPSRNVAVLSRDVTIVEHNFPGAQLERSEQGLSLLEDVEQNGNQTAKPLSSPTSIQAARGGESRIFQWMIPTYQNKIQQKAHQTTKI